MMGLIGMSNNPMVSATVACAIAVEEALNAQSLLRSCERWLIGPFTRTIKATAYYLSSDGKLGGPSVHQSAAGRESYRAGSSGLKAANNVSSFLAKWKQMR